MEIFCTYSHESVSNNICYVIVLSTVLTMDCKLKSQIHTLTKAATPALKCYMKVTHIKSHILATSIQWSFISIEMIGQKSYCHSDFLLVELMLK